MHHHHHHHHHIALVARISLTLSRHFSLSFIALGRSSGQHPVSSHSCWMYVRAHRPAFARPCVGVHKSTPLMSSSLLLQQCPACLARLTWIVFVIRGRWPYSWCLVGCCPLAVFHWTPQNSKCPSGLQDSPQYFSLYWKFRGLDSCDFSSDFHFLFSFFQTLLNIQPHQLQSVSLWPFAQSRVGGVEYTDCFSAGGKTLPTTSVLGMILNNLMVRFQ